MIVMVIKLVGAVSLPVVVFFGGVWIMSIATGRDHVRQVLSNGAEADQRPLNERLNYNLDAVDRHWSALAKDARALSSEQRFLELDLIFPFFYGASFAASLLVFWALLGRPFNPCWFMTPVVITLLADWTENLVLLSQLLRFEQGGKQALNANWILVASNATLMKLTIFTISSLFIGAMLIAFISSRVGRRRTGTGPKRVDS